MSFFTSLSKGNIRKAALTGVVLLVSFLLIDRSLSAVFTSLSDLWVRAQEVKGKNYIFLDKINVDVLIMGSSRAYRAFDPDLLGRLTGYSVRHEASNGKYIRYNYEFYKKYRSFSSPPKVLIWGLDYFIFGFKSFNNRLAQIGVLEKGENQPDGDTIPVARSLTLMERVSKLFRNKAVFQSQFYDFLKSFNNPDENIKKREYPRVTTHVRRRTIPPRHSYTFHFHRPPGVEGKYLDRFFELLRRDGVTVFLVTLPDYIATWESHLSKDEYVSAWRKIASRYDFIHFVHVNDPSQFDIHNHLLFKDGGYGKISSHLNHSGAVLLTRRIAGMLKKGP